MPLVFLLEEPSMQVFLETYLPLCFNTLHFRCIPHEGKSDLEKSIPRKLKSWNEPFFIIVRDNDGSDCNVLKQRLLHICRSAGRPDSKVRIVCQALEAWYLGVPAVVAEEYQCEGILKFFRKPKNVDPDTIREPDKLLQRLIPEFRKLEGAERIGKRMPTDFSKNNSHSFRVFMKTIDDLQNIVKGV